MAPARIGNRDCTHARIDAAHEVDRQSRHRRRKYSVPGCVRIRRKPGDAAVQCDRHIFGRQRHQLDNIQRWKQVQTTFDGQSIFGDSAGGLINALTSLVNNLNAGNHAGVSATLPQLQAALQTLAQARSSIGSNLDALANVVSNSNSKIVTLQTTQSDLVDADVAQEAMKEQQTTLQQQALVQLGSTPGKIPLINILA